MGGKVQAPSGYADHVIFIDPAVCETCRAPVCIEICSGQALNRGSTGVPLFDREKCVFCGACLWNCPEGNIEFRAGAGGLHSAQN
jgi:electron-transferring-flavoprotein dehydrogenase